LVPLPARIVALWFRHVPSERTKCLPRNTRIYLKTVGHICTELARQYRRADRGELDWQSAAAASRILRELRQTLEGSELEQRIAALEAALAERDERRPAQINGHGLGARP
jgi:hypothetical protein